MKDKLPRYKPRGFQHFTVKQRCFDVFAGAVMCEVVECTHNYWSEKEAVQVKITVFWGFSFSCEPRGH